MAIFEGSVQEFHHIIGPRIKNAVNSLTRKARSDLKGICEHCGQKQYLDSAHVHGKERRSIIESVIKPFVVNDTIKCNVEMVEKKIIDAHEPISSTFKFLCKSCHREYDKQSVVKTQRTSSRKESKNKDNNDFTKLHKIELWLKKPHQINSKIVRAFLFLCKNSDVSRDNLKMLCSDEGGHPDFIVKDFDSHFASMKTDSGHSHGKVFFEKDGYVYMYPEVERLIKGKFFE